MRSNARWEERIGAVFLPEAGEIAVDHDDGAAAGAQPVPKHGCYTVQHTPTGAGRQGSRFRGTLRVELTGDGPRISGDLYRYRGDAEPDEAAEVTTIPVYSRRSYNSYLRGTGAGLLSTPFTLDFEQFTYRHPASGFDGSFPKNPSRRVRFTLDPTPTVDLFRGQMHVLPPSGGQRLLGEVSIRWISPFFRRAIVQLNTLTGAIPPPAVDGRDIRSIFADLGWDLTVADGGSIGLPPALSRVNPNKEWSEKNLHTLMRSVPGYDPAGLDSEWRVHLVVVPATMGCNRGLMFDTEPTDPNGVPREGAATFSHDGYRPEDFGPGGRITSTRCRESGSTRCPVPTSGRPPTRSAMPSTRSTRATRAASTTRSCPRPPPWPPCWAPRALSPTGSTWRSTRRSPATSATTPTRRFAPAAWSTSATPSMPQRLPTSTGSVACASTWSRRQGGLAWASRSPWSGG